MKKIVKIFTPKHQQILYLLYCSGIFKYDEIYFSESFNTDTTFCKINIIDFELFKNFFELRKKINKNFRYIIFFPNGEKQYQEILKKIEYLESILGKKIEFFFVGNATEIKYDKMPLVFERFDKIKFYNASLRHTICFKYPIFFSLLAIFKNLKFFFKNNKKRKICFTGLVKVDKKLINHLKSDWNFSNKSVQVLELLMNIDEQNFFYDELMYRCKKYFSSKDFINNQLYEKYFMSQIIFRNFLMNILKKNPNFYLQDWDNRSKIMDSIFFKNFIFLDFGSTAGKEKIYFRFLVLKFFKKKSLRVNFFDDHKGFNFISAHHKMFSYLSELNKKNINKLDFNQLKIELERSKNFL